MFEERTEGEEVEIVEVLGPNAAEHVHAISVELTVGEGTGLDHLTMGENLREGVRL